MALTPAERQKRWREKNPEKVKEKHKKYAEKNKERCKEYYSNNKDKAFERYLKNTYQMSVEEYETSLKNQSEVCAICKSKCVSGKKLAVDHNHDTGEFRGVLCRQCNRALGMFRDSPTILHSALEYLELNGSYGDVVDG